MSRKKFKKRGRSSWLNRKDKSRKLLKQGNIVEYLNKIINFEVFKEELEANMLNQEEENGFDCESFDVVMMFKIILLKRFYSSSDETAEYDIIDRFTNTKKLKTTAQAWFLWFER